jgi:HTH-type transcriptional regulator/antitoxin HigA
MVIRPIKTEEDYQVVLEEIERLFNAEPDTPEADRLDVLATLVEAYEEDHYPIPRPDSIEAIKYHMESRGLSRRDLEPYIGTRARVSEVLNRRRPLTLRMIRNLEAGLGIPAETLIQPYALVPSGEESVAEAEVVQAGAQMSVPLLERLSRHKEMSAYPASEAERKGQIVYVAWDREKGRGYYVDTRAHTSAPVQ